MEKQKEIKYNDDAETYSYSVSQVNTDPEIDSDWDKKFWSDTDIISLNNYMGERPRHFPETKAKVRYDAENIYVIFKVKDQYVMAKETKINGKVWHDSCVEFFFTPGPDISAGYFNFEANCKGIFLFQYHTNDGQTNEFVDIEDCKRIEIAHSLQQDAKEEIKEPVTWTIEYRIPFSILEKYMRVVRPEPGVNWRANFYKCADQTSHPHWLTWAEVDYPKPKFHLPEFFGVLEFE